MVIEQTGNDATGYTVYNNPNGSWADVSHMLYIDQPVGTGFSYGEPLLTNMDDVSSEFKYFLLQFYDIYPVFQGHQLILSGESYAGKYIPRFAYQLLLHNEAEATTIFNLTSVLIGDPYIAPLSQRTSMYKLPRALNILDISNMAQIAALNMRCEASF